MGLDFYISHLDPPAARSFRALRPGDAVCVSLPGDDRLRWLTVADIDWERETRPIAVTLDGSDKLWVCVSHVDSVALAKTRRILH